MQSKMSQEKWLVYLLQIKFTQKVKKLLHLKQIKEKKKTFNNRHFFLISKSSTSKLVNKCIWGYFKCNNLLKLLNVKLL